jgi:dipeptidyl aminopeptidase/acylaminoacyl peptidase
MTLSSEIERFMNSRKTEIIWFLIVVFVSFSGIHFPISSAQQAKKPFTVADEIGLALFDNPDGGPAEVLFSPDGTYFVVKTERGRLDINRVEDEVRFYCSRDVRNFLDHSNEPQMSAVWTVARTGKEGGVIAGWRWLADSSGIAFLEPTENGNHRLVLADLQKKTVEPLTPETEMVKAFDVRDRQHYVYSVADPGEQEKNKVEREAAFVVGTGRSLFELILPNDPITARIAPSSISLWAAIGSKRIEVKKAGAPLANFGNFALSPDGKSLVTSLPVLDVPSAWEALYPPPPSTVSKNRIHSGHYDAKSSHVHQLVRIDLQTGAIESLTDAPLADDAGWIAIGDPSWSSDGREILLPNTFLKSKDNSPSRPCVAVMDVSSDVTTCVEVLMAPNAKTSGEEGYHLVFGARFASGTGHVMVAFISHQDESFRTTEYQRTNDSWQAVTELRGSFPAEQNGLEVSVKQGLNDPPMLVAATKQTSRVIWDPNPQVNNIELGQASVYTWKDKEGREWKGGLYKPINYKPGQRYPLVIQTHGFSASEFRPSGVFPTAFAARALAATGIVVLQTATGVAGANCAIVTPEEGPCAIAMLESAANQLVSDGLVDRERIGIIGFSRTCFYAMEMLTTGSLHLKAASVTDGVMEDYFQYILNPDRASGESNSMIGAPPFGDGLQLWLKSSPGFNLDKITAPLLVVGEGPVSLLFMWQPYAGLRYLHKPVDLIMLNTGEHVLTNPAVRMESQGGTVDWFRFWLKDEEDPDPAKAGQYARWRESRELQKKTQN